MEGADAEVGLQVLQQAGVVFVGGAAGDTIAEFFADDIAAGVHSLNGMVGAGGLAVELAGYRRLQGLLPCNPVVGI